MIKTLAILALSAALLAQSRPGDAPATPATAQADAAVRFSALDVFVDAGAGPLAAYQFEWKVTAGDVTLVGIEGGEHAAFKNPPHYDPRALSRQRVIVAAFNTGTDLPRGRTRVARLMVQVRGDARPTYEATVQAAASADAKPIPASISVSDAILEGASR